MTAPSNALVTASYKTDFGRCRILCESVDRHVTGFETHYILVDDTDAALFKQLEGPNRQVISDSDLLPRRLLRIADRLAPGGKTVWLGTGIKPMHGWHMQQFRRIAIAAYASEEGLFYCDSDTAFVKPFDATSIWRDGRMRLFREDGGSDEAQSDHLAWLSHASRCLALSAEPTEHHNYVRTFLSWKRSTVIAMCDHIEANHGRDWMSVIGSSRKFSECTLYGTYVDEVLDGKDHWHDNINLCPMHWFNPPPDENALRALVAGLKPEEVGVGVQSFIAIDNEMFERVVLGD